MGHWLDQNCKTRQLRQALRDYQVEYNRMFEYNDLHLLEDMSWYETLTDKDPNRSRVVPPDKELNNDLFDRISLFKWFMKNYPHPQPIPTSDDYQSMWKNCGLKFTTLLWFK